MASQQDISIPELPDRLEGVPLFPLPGVVLFPRAVLPLHIFEPRYRAMTADALAADGPNAGLVVMGHLIDGAVTNTTPPVHDVAGVGLIVEHEQLDDGRYNLLLVGLRRVRVEHEYVVDDQTPYRRADVAVLDEAKVMEIDLDEPRRRMHRVLARPPLSELALGRQLGKLLDGPHATNEVAGLIAFELLEDADEKQRILDEPDVRRRVSMTARAFDRQYPDPADAALRAELQADRSALMDEPGGDVGGEP